ncbi:MAG: hypothetical protein AVDCRST_MAG16-1626 [uncultured Frankineae bacterium]|uniref:Uncharacterized protein n=1 Tax=uncultured Frankineae bacterium TaxID=437475 RepID=A0A6J4LNW5_9ACTN|nr:MAG: hypothetical protein AVDCRST_MAG16-1626 [uncultured Frankineae bacterium]
MRARPRAPPRVRPGAGSTRRPLPVGREAAVCRETAPVEASDGTVSRLRR